MDKILYLSQFDLMSSLSEADLIEMDGMTSITIIPKNRQIAKAPVKLRKSRSISATDCKQDISNWSI